MTTITLAGIEFNNFGCNNYSNGMELVTVTYPPKDLVQRVLNKEIFGRWASPKEINGVKGMKLTTKYIFLNPSAPCCEDEFFGVLGTEEQYQEFYKQQADSQIAKHMIAKFGTRNWPEKEITDAYEEALRKGYKDWWDLP